MTPCHPTTKTNSAAHLTSKIWCQHVGIRSCASRGSVPRPSGNYRRVAIVGGAVVELAELTKTPALERAVLLLRAPFSACSAADAPWDLLPRLRIRKSNHDPALWSSSPCPRKPHILKTLPCAPPRRCPAPDPPPLPCTGLNPCTTKAQVTHCPEKSDTAAPPRFTTTCPPTTKTASATRSIVHIWH